MSSAFWRDRPVLVTGATGLLGGWLVKSLLEDSADVVCLVRDWVPQSELVRSADLDRVRVVRGDVRDFETVRRALGEYEIRTVFHLAAQTIVGIANGNPLSTFETNIAGTWTVLEACRQSPHVDSIAVASSDKAYGESAGLPYGEDMPLQGRHPYDVSKSCADLIARAYAETYRSPVTVVRCGNFYGGGDLNWNRLVPGTIRSVLRGEPVVVRSDGKLVRDYLYVEDAVAAYRLVAEHLVRNDVIRGRAFNFSGEHPLAVLDLIARILQTMDSSAEIQVLDQAHGEISSQVLNTDRARQLLGWAPQFPLEHGLARTVEWYRDFFGSSPHDYSGREFTAADSRSRR